MKMQFSPTTTISSFSRERFLQGGKAHSMFLQMKHHLDEVRKTWFMHNLSHSFPSFIELCLLHAHARAKCNVRPIHNFLVQLVSMKNVHSIIISEASIIKRSMEGLWWGDHRVCVCVLKACLWRVHQSRRKKKKRKENCVDENHFCNGDKAHDRRKMLDVFFPLHATFLPIFTIHTITSNRTVLFFISLESDSWFLSLMVQFHHLRIVGKTLTSPWSENPVTWNEEQWKIQRLFNNFLALSLLLVRIVSVLSSMDVHSESCKYSRGKATS